MINECFIIGRVVAEPELRNTINGDSWVNFTIAVNRGNSENTDFIDCVAYKKTAENFCKYVRKGNKIAITGTLRTNIKDNYKYTNVRVIHLEFLESNKNTDIYNINDDIEIPEGE